jgi:hypothetical protein
MSLHSKIADVMGEIGTIPKNGRNTFHGYDYVLEADIVEAVRQKLASRSVALYASSRLVETREWRTPPSKNNPDGKPTLITHIQVDITFADGESGETFTITSAGTGDDASDKGTYKAITGAVKYALMKTFLIPTGDEPERDHGHDDRSEPAPPARSSSQAIQEAIDNLIKAVGRDNAQVAYNLALQNAGVTPGAVPTTAQAKQIIDSLQAATGVPA